jgi:SAM-dependent methyltransferase
VKREDWDLKYSEEQLWGARPYRFLEPEIAGLAPGRALDLACGEGRHAILLADLGWRVTGVDFSEVAIATARERAARARVDVDFRHEDVLDFEPEPGAFDLVLVIFLHLPTGQRRRVLARAAAALAPGGTLLLVGHDLLNATEGVGGPSDPSLLYTPDDVAAELPGLEIEKAERVRRDVDGEERAAIDALVRARRPSGA